MHMTALVMIHTLPGVRTRPGIGPVISGFLFMLAGVMVLRGGLTPFRRLRERLMALRRGNDRRLEGAYPAEVQPLIDDLNALLENREKAVDRAVRTAGDLAHGLKTPLALLAQEAERAAAQGNRELADNIAQQVERMTRQVTYHLARARAASGAAGAVPCPVAPAVEALIRTLLKLYAGREIAITSNIAADVSVRVRREDLDEMLGNLLDNACKWANSQIVLGADREDGMVVLSVDDDGRGLDAEQRVKVLERGVRLDEATPGSGLGLAIVRDLAELYGGSISLAASGSGGLAARVSLPAG